MANEHQTTEAIDAATQRICTAMLAIKIQADRRARTVVERLEEAAEMRQARRELQVELSLPQEHDPVFETWPHGFTLGEAIRNQAQTIRQSRKEEMHEVSRAQHHCEGYGR